MKINCKYSELVPIEQVIPTPLNANVHTDQQIKLLARLIEYQGFRHPIIVSKRSGFIVAGHARLEAAKINKYEKVPVDFQEFENEAQEYAFLISDNKIAELGQTNLGMVNEHIGTLGPDFDIELLGMPDFTVEPMDRFETPNEKELDENIDTQNECPKCEYKW